MSLPQELQEQLSHQYKVGGKTTADKVREYMDAHKGEEVTMDKVLIGWFEQTKEVLRRKAVGAALSNGAKRGEYVRVSRSVYKKAKSKISQETDNTNGTSQTKMVVRAEEDKE